MLALTVRRPETFRYFLDAAGKCSCSLPFNASAYTGTEEAFTVTNLDTMAVEPELERSNGHSRQEIVIIQLSLKDTRI